MTNEGTPKASRPNHSLVEPLSHSLTEPTRRGENHRGCGYFYPKGFGHTLNSRRYHISVCCCFAAAVWILSSDTITIERSPLAPRSQSSSLFHHCHWLMEPGLDLETFDFPPQPSGLDLDWELLKIINSLQVVGLGLLNSASVLRYHIHTHNGEPARAKTSSWEQNIFLRVGMLCVWLDGGSTRKKFPCLPFFKPRPRKKSQKRQYRCLETR